MVDGRNQYVKMKSVVYVSTMIYNHMSVRNARRAAFRVTFDCDEDDTGDCEITHRDSVKVYMKEFERPVRVYEAYFLLMWHLKHLFRLRKNSNFGTRDLHMLAPV